MKGNRGSRWNVATTLLLLLLPMSAALAAEVAVPPEIREWQSWVLDGHEQHQCPWLVPGSSEDNHRICAWPSPLGLQIDAHGGRFTQRWQAAAETWLWLPGNADCWPEAVTIDGAPAAVVSHAGVPAVRVSSGSHLISGAFRWERRPHSLAVPSSVGLIDLDIDGTRVSAPQRGGDTAVLGASQTSQVEDHLDVRVFRRLFDDLPARLTTEIRLSVAGEAREIRLPQTLPEGFLPIAIHSGLAARLDPDGTLRVQVRPGEYAMTLEAHGPSPIAAVGLGTRPSPWPSEEVWSFDANDRLRVAAIEGAPSVDPGQSNVPPEWRNLPAYRVTAASSLRVVEHSRGLAAQNANELRLRRTAWLDFSGASYTIVDRIDGRMNQRWRLDMASPYAVKSASLGDDSLLVTTGSVAGTSGVELRVPDVHLTAISQVARAAGALPATGWRERFVAVTGELVLAPGYRLLATFGPDASPSAWLDRWHLFDIFAILLITTVAWRVMGPGAAAVAAAAVLLTYEEADAPNWLWLNALIALAAVRAVPEGRLKRLVMGYRALALVIVVIAFVPFALTQIRLAIYPQLEALDTGSVIAPPRAVAVDMPPPAQDNFTQSVPRQIPAQGTVLQTAIAPSAPAPRTALKAVAGQYSSAGTGVQQIAITGQQRATQYEPGAVTQAGPGIPAWRYHTYEYMWNGPVEAAESVRFIVSPPWLTRGWRIVGILLSVLFLLQLTKHVAPRLPGWWPRRWLNSAAIVVACCALALFVSSPSSAASTPDPAILDALKGKLLAGPKCAPTCADVMAAEVKVSQQRIAVVLTASALDALGLALPGATPDWNPDLIQIDGSAAGLVYRNAQGVRFVSLARGRHVIRIEGSVANLDALTLAFPVPPHVIDISSDGWDVAGLAARRLVSGALELARRRTVQTSAGASSGQSEFPPFVNVERLIHIGHQWTVATTVTRIAPTTGAFTVRVPLLAQEAITSSGLEVKDGSVTIGLGSDDDSHTYDSVLPTTDTIVLVAKPDTSRSEHWRFEVGSTWHAEFAGLKAVPPEGEPSEWTFDYFPRPGEQLNVAITRPSAIAGGTIAFDRVVLHSEAGRRSTDNALELTYRSTQGGRHVIQLPTDAAVTSVTEDGQSLAVRPEHSELSLSVLPGSHRWTINWQTPIGAQLLTRAPSVNLTTPSTNISLSVRVPDDRWVLFTFGSGVGPTILYWGELLVFILIAWLLGRSGWTPLATREWLLLGLGLSTFSWLVLGLFALFVAAFQWRARVAAPAARDRFNLSQIGLGALAAAAILALVAAVPRGLLASPDMRIQSPDSGGQLVWFIDQAAGNLPSPGVLSVSLWWYKLAMLAWALWLSFALVRWIKWAWQIYTRDGLWRGPAELPPVTPP